MEIKALTFNIHHGQGIDGKSDLHRIADLIEECGADIVGLNELDRCYSKRSGFVDQLTWLSGRLNMNAAFAASLTLKSAGDSCRGQYGNALLSRFPIVSESYQRLGSVRSGVKEARVLLEAVLQAGERQFKLYVTHLTLNPVAHRRQVDVVIDKIAADRQPVILMGDMNMRPRSNAWEKITKVLADASLSSERYPCRTFPSLRPAAQLDYIFTSSQFQCITAEAIRKYAVASDHLPLMATMVLT